VKEKGEVEDSGSEDDFLRGGRLDMRIQLELQRVLQRGEEKMGGSAM